VKKKRCKTVKPRPQTDAEFEMEYLERRAQGDAAWGQFAAIQRGKSYAKDKQQLERAVSSASSSFERKNAEQKLAEFHRSTRTAGSFLVVGAGGPHIDID
jgi:hypothetical protein